VNSEWMNRTIHMEFTEKSIIKDIYVVYYTLSIYMAAD
jgi:hypothetical protein